MEAVRSFFGEGQYKSYSFFYLSCIIEFHARAAKPMASSPIEFERARRKGAFEHTVQNARSAGGARPVAALPKPCAGARKIAHGRSALVDNFLS